jgi:transcriptional regulator with XRE-family HTH domain
MSARCRSCGALLSRYNPGATCAPCAPPETSWRSPDVREAVAAGDLGLMLSIIRRDAGMSQLEMGQILGWSASQVHRVEHGQRQTLYDVRVLLQVCDALRIPRAVLKPLWLDPADSGDEAVDMNRREFARAMLAAAALGVLPPEIPATSGLPVHVDAPRLRSLTDELYSQDQFVGGGTLLQTATQHLSAARRQLHESDLSEAHGRELMAAIGELTVCTGWLTYDGGHYGVARVLVEQALALGDQADDDDLRVHALEVLALLFVAHARLTGAPTMARHALRLVEGASRAAAHAEPRVHALLAARKAVAYATLRDRTAYQRSIAAAARELERSADPDDAPVWLRFVAPPELAAAEAKGRLYLDEAPHAVELYGRALTEATTPRNRLIYRAQRGAALAASGDIAAAISEGRAVLPTLSQVASLRTLRELSPVRDAAALAGDEELIHQYDAAADKLQLLAA